MKRKLTVDENCQQMYAVLDFSGETKPIGYIYVYVYVYVCVCVCVCVYIYIHTKRFILRNWFM